MLTASTETAAPEKETAATSVREHNISFNMIVESKAHEAAPDREDGGETEGEAMIESEIKPSEEEDKENLTENSDAQNPGEKDPKDDEPAEDDLCTLWVGQLHKSVTEEILFELFLQAGPVISARIPNDKEGKRRTFGFVEYVYDVSVPYAMALFEGTKLFGREIRMNSKNPERVNMEMIRREMAFVIQQNQRQKLATTSNIPQPHTDVVPQRLIPEATIARPLLPCPPAAQKSPLLPLPLLDNCQRPRPLLDNASWQSPQLGRGLMGAYPGAGGLRTLMDVGPTGETWPPLMFQPRPRETNAPTFLLRPGPCGASGHNDWNAAVRASCVTRPLLMQRSSHFKDDPRRYIDKRLGDENGSARPILCEKQKASVEIESDDKDDKQPWNSVDDRNECHDLNSTSDTENHGSEKSDTVVTKGCGNTKSNCSDLQNVRKDRMTEEKISEENDDSKTPVIIKSKGENVLPDSFSCDQQNLKDTEIKVENVELEDLDEVESQNKIEKLTKVKKSVQLENSINIENTVKVENSGKRDKTVSCNVSGDDSITEAKNDTDINRIYDSKKSHDATHDKEEKDFTHTTRIDVKSAVYSNSAYKSTEPLHDVDKAGMTLKGNTEDNVKEKAFIRWADRLLESQGKTPDGGFVFRKCPSDRSVVDVSKPVDAPSTNASQITPIDHPLQLLNSSLQTSLSDGNKNIDPIQAFVKMAESNKLKGIESNEVCLQDPKPTPVLGKPVNNKEQVKVDHITGPKSIDANEQQKTRDVSAIKCPPPVVQINSNTKSDLGRMKTYSQVVNSNEAPKAENGIKSYSQVASKPPVDKVLLTREPKHILGASSEAKVPGSLIRCRDAMSSPTQESNVLRKAMNSNVLRDVKLFKDKVNHSNKDVPNVSNQPVVNATEKRYIVLEDMNTITKKEQEFPKSPPPFFRAPEYTVPKKSYSPGDPCGIIDEIMRQGRPVEIITDCGSVRYMNQGCRPISNGKVSQPTNKFVNSRPPSDIRRDATTKVYGGNDLYPPGKCTSTVLESSCLGVSRDGACHVGRGRGRGQSRCLGQGSCRRPAAPPPVPGYRR